MNINLPVERILVIKLSAFGDVVLAAGAIRDIRNHHPGAELICMTTPAYRRVMERCPWVDSVFIDPRASRWRLDKMAELRARLRKLGVDLVYDLQQAGRTAFYRRWFLPDVPWLGKGPGCRYRVRDLGDRGAMDRFALQLAAAGMTVEHTLKPDVAWMADDVTEILRRNKVSEPFVVLIPGASSGHDEKRWPHYDALAGWLGRRGKEVVTVPGPDELELCRSYSNTVMLTDGERYLDFFELAGVLQRAEFVLGNDTGPTHLAAHLNLHGLALFNNHLPARRTGIQHTRFSVIETDDLQNLSLDRVQEKVLSLLELE